MIDNSRLLLPGEPFQEGDWFTDASGAKWTRLGNGLWSKPGPRGLADDALARMERVYRSAPSTEPEVVVVRVEECWFFDVHHIISCDEEDDAKSFALVPVNNDGTLPSLIKLGDDLYGVAKVGG